MDSRKRYCPRCDHRWFAKDLTTGAGRLRRQRPRILLALAAIMAVLCLGQFKDLAISRYRLSKAASAKEQADLDAAWAALQAARSTHPKPDVLSRLLPRNKRTPAYRDPPPALAGHPELTDGYDDLILASSRRHGLNPRLVKAIIAAESEFSTRALSRRGARGLMQLLPGTAEEVGVTRQELEDPEANIRAGTAYLGFLFAAAWRQYRLQGREYADAPVWVLERIIAAYNAGPRALNSYNYVLQTQVYVKTVLLYYRSDFTQFGPGSSRALRAGLR
jgi:soluble lytic murein transglycosylase-like protein